MAPFAGLVSAVASLGVVAVVGRAVALLLRSPESDHGDLVSARERRLSTALGVPLLLVGVSTMAGGPLSIPYDPLPITLLGLVLTVHPDFTPSSLG